MGNDFVIKTNTKKENQHFFLNTEEIFGIQSIDGSYSQNATPLKFIGMTEPIMVPNGPQKGQFNLSTLVIDRDYFSPLTGNSGFCGYIINNRSNYNENFSFVSGYLTSYQSACSIGEIPQVGVGFTVFGNVGRFGNDESTAVSGHFSSISGGSSTLSPHIAGPGSISLNLDDFTTNRVLSYDLSINVNRNAIYPLGTRTPTKVEINYPLDISLGFQFAVNDYTPQKLYNFPVNPKVKNITLTLKTFDTDATIINYVFNDMFLVEESVQAGVNGQSTIIGALYRSHRGRGNTDAGTSGG